MPKRTALRVAELESREVPSGTQLFAIAEDGGQGRVAVFRPANEYVVSNVTFGGPDFLLQEGTPFRTFAPFEGYRGGVRVAVGDVTGDGVDDIVVAAGQGGGPHVKVYGGSQLLAGQLTVVAEFLAFDGGFRGGVFLAVGQMDPTSPQKEIVVGAGEGGGPHVRVFALDRVIFALAPGIAAPEYYFSRIENEFFAFSADFRGGVRVAAGDVTGDGRAELIAAAGPGGGPHVRVFDVNHPDPLALPAFRFRIVDEFFAYNASFRGGVYVAAGQVTGDAQHAEVVTGAGAGGGPHVKLYARDTNGRLAVNNQAFVGTPALTSGVHVGLADLGFGTSTNPTPRPSFIYFSTGFDPAETRLPTDREIRIGGFNFSLGSFARTTVSLPAVFADDPNSRLAVAT
jgi:hypothetical protein